MGMDGDNMKEKIMSEYHKKYDVYCDFCHCVERLIGVSLAQKGIVVHSITSRIKEAKSLEKKIEKKRDKYSSLEDLTDIAGIRIITYFEDDADIISKIIKEEFSIDEDNSIDKRAILDPDRFGYLSVHYVIALRSGRVALPEYRKYAGCKVEIQIRSILQHAWAEIEHDLGYKSKVAIPREIRRNFSRLAGLLEIADQEFKQIRRHLKEYEKNIFTQIKVAPEAVTIDKVSLGAFLANNAVLTRINQRIAQKMEHCEIYQSEEVGIESMILKLDYVQIRTMAELNSFLVKEEEKVVFFAQKMLANMYDELPDTIAIYYLCYALVGKSGSEDVVYQYLKNFGIGDEGSRRGKAQEIIRTYQELSVQ